MFQAFLLKYAEIGIKGKNRHIFEEALAKEVRYKLSRAEGEFEVTRINGRIFVEAKSEFDYEGALKALQKVFGVVGISPVTLVEDMSPESVKTAAISYIQENYISRGETDFSFKVESRRANKAYPVPSMELNADVGEALLLTFPTLRVDVHEPDVRLKIELRDRAYLYARTFKGAGGLPLGTNGRALLLLSGGFDSPVAGYMISRRGVYLDAVYFDSPPYTSDRAKQKVMDLAKVLAGFSGPVRLHIIRFTELQLAIYQNCPHDQLTIIMRRYMMKIAQRIAEDTPDCLGLITGESIGQVASQTMKSLYATDDACTIPVYRPLAGFDKQEIIDRAEAIGTAEISVLPYEDCCTIFVAKHPVTKPSLKVIRASEQNLSAVIDGLLEDALKSDEVIRIGP